MSDMTPDGPPRPATGGPMTARMQELLSQHAEEQLVEQRQVSVLLGELRTMVAGLGEQLRGTASSARLDTLEGDVAALAHELRTGTAGIGERLDAVARRVDDQAASTAEVLRGSGEGTEALGVRVTALRGDIVASAEGIDRLRGDIAALSSFPDSLAVLQREVSGLHDRLAPLAEVRTGLADLTARTGAIEALRPDVAAVQQRLEGLVSSDELARARDSLSATLGERLERWDAIVSRPSVTPEQLAAGLAPVRAQLDEIGSTAPVLARIGELDGAIGALGGRVDAVAERLSDVGDAAGGVPALATDLSAVSRRLDELGRLPADVADVRTSVMALSEDSPLPSLVLGVATLREDVEELGGRVAELSIPTAASVAGAVSQQITDRIVDALAPRVADLVLTRVAATLVAQVAGSVTTSVQDGLTERVRTATADSERRITTHVDEAVLALAEALLRRRRPPSRQVAAALEPGLTARREQPTPPDGQSDAGSPDAADPVVRNPEVELVRDPEVEPEGAAPAAEQAPSDEFSAESGHRDVLPDAVGGGVPVPVPGQPASEGRSDAEPTDGDRTDGGHLVGDDPADLDDPPAAVAPSPGRASASEAAEGGGASAAASDVATPETPTAAHDATPLVDTAPAPQSSFRSFVLPRTTTPAPTADQDDGQQAPSAGAAEPQPAAPQRTETQSTETRPAEAQHAKTQHAKTQPAGPGAATEEPAADSDSSAPRRPWWRPGG